MQREEDLKKEFWTETLKWDDIWKVITKEQMLNARPAGNMAGWYYNGGWKFGEYYAQTPGFYKLQRTVSKMEDPTHVYLFVGDADAPGYVFDSVNYYSVMLKDDTFHEQFFGRTSAAYVDSSNIGGTDYSTSSGNNKTLRKFLFGTDATTAGYISWKVVYGINLAWIWQMCKDRGTPTAIGTNWSVANYKAIKDVFGFENPFTSKKIVWAIRNRGRKDDFRNSGRKTPSTTEIYTRYVFCLPYDKSGETGSTLQSLCEAASTKYTVQQWADNFDNCRYKLTLNTCFLVIGEVRNGSVKNCQKFNITSFIPATSIRFDEYFYDTNDLGDRFNKFCFSTDLVLEDMTTIRFRAGGQLRIISFITRERYQDNGMLFNTGGFYTFGWQQLGHYLYTGKGPTNIGLGASNGHVAAPHMRSNSFTMLNDQTLACTNGSHITGSAANDLLSLFNKMSTGSENDYSAFDPDGSGTYPYIWLKSIALHADTFLDANGARVDAVKKVLAQLWTSIYQVVSDKVNTARTCMPGLMAYRF